MEDHLGKFNEIILNLVNIDICIDDGDQAILLLIFLDASYTNLKETMIYGRESLILEEVQYVLYSKILQNKLELKFDTGEGLLVWVGTKKYNPKAKNKRDRSKLKIKKLKYFHCHKEWYFKRNCPKIKITKIEKSKFEKIATIVMDVYDSAEILTVLEVDYKKG